MTLQAKLQAALAASIIEHGITADVQAAITMDENDSFSQRVVCLPGSCTERQTLRGIYNAEGTVVVLTSIDIENAIATHLHLCDSVRELIGDTADAATKIMDQDATIQIYNRSWHCEGMEDDAGNRGYKSTFSWRAVARDTAINQN